MRSHAAGKQCVSVRMRRRHASAADRAAAAADVLDDQGLPKNVSHLLGNDARHHVAWAAGGERHHYSDRSDRIATFIPMPRPKAGCHRGNAEDSNHRRYEKLSTPHKTNTS